VPSKNSATVLDRPDQVTNLGRDAQCCPHCGERNVENRLSAPDRFHGRRTFYTLLRCPSCSLVWLKDPPPPAQMGQHYGVDYDRAIAGGGGDPDHWRSRREALLRYKSSGAILDLGCSTGGFLTSLKGDPWQLFGIEMSEAVATQARKSSGAQVFVGDILDAPFAPCSFDAITCFHVFEHLYQPWEVLAKIAEWLRPGGVFYTMMPNIDSAGARIFESFWYALELPRHLFHFSPASLRCLCKAAGLEERLVATHREVFIEASTRYLFDEACRRVGIKRVPLSQIQPPSLPWRIVRKAYRLTVLPALTSMASLAGDGESIHAVFMKSEA
jgi:SAM-dependent methyltransferase